MVNVYNLSNPELIQAFKKNDMEKVKQIVGSSTFLIPIKNKDNIHKISFESIMNSKKELYLPLFINMADVEMNPMIKGKQILIAHFGMIDTILNNNKNLKGIVINPHTMNCIISRNESKEILEYYHQSGINFEPDFYQKETFTMADLKPEPLMPRSEVVISIINYLETTPIKKAYINVKKLGNKLHYQIYLQYGNNDKSFVEELHFKVEKLLDEKESFEIQNIKEKKYAKLVQYLKPVYEKKQH